MRLTALNVSILTWAACSHAASNDEWAQRSIYQVITDRYARVSGASGECNITKYCGGSWRGLVEKLDYIQNMGFTAVQISPVTRNLEQDTLYGEAFHGYWQQDMTTLNAHFGSPDDLKHLSTELHKRGMYLLLDVVSNEMAVDIGDANMTSTTTIDYATFGPFNTPAQYDPYCAIEDWANQTQLTECWLGHTVVATPRIKTTDAGIRRTLQAWIKKLVETYDIDGIRVDGAKQIEMSFFPDFVRSAGVYAMGEVDADTANFTCNYQSALGGLENYPVYFALVQAFTAGKMAQLVDMVAQVNQACSKPQYLANFVENQDQPRFASLDNDLALAKNALAFTMIGDGIPKMYYGQEQHLTGNYSPYNRQALWVTGYDTSAPLYQLASTLNRLRHHAIAVDGRYVTELSQLLYSDPSTYAARKGPNGAQIVGVLSNQGSHGGKYTLAVPGAGDPGTNLTEVMTCETALADTNGTVVVRMDKGEPRVLFPTEYMKGSGLCGYEKATNMTSSSSGTGTTGTTTSGLGSGSAATASSTKKGSAVGVRVPHPVWVMAVLGVASWMLV